MKKRSDFSSIIGGFAVFISFIVSLAILHYFITLSSEKVLMILDKNTNTMYERSLELISFLNNKTLATSPELDIKNIGEVSLDLSCFRLYINGNLTTFTYTINELYKNGLLDPGENATLYLPPGSIGWKQVTLVSCKGNRFETLLDYT